MNSSGRMGDAAASGAGLVPAVGGFCTAPHPGEAQEGAEGCGDQLGPAHSPSCRRWKQLAGTAVSLPGEHGVFPGAVSLSHTGCRARTPSHGAGRQRDTQHPRFLLPAGLTFETSRHKQVLLRNAVNRPRPQGWRQRHV